MLLYVFGFSIGSLVFLVTDSPITAVMGSLAVGLGLAYVDEKIDKIVEAIKSLGK